MLGIGFLIGLLVGGTVGAFAMALATMSSRAESRYALDEESLVRHDEIVRAAESGTAKSAEIAVGAGSGAGRGNIDRKR